MTLPTGKVIAVVTAAAALVVYREVRDRASLLAELILGQDRRATQPAQTAPIVEPEPLLRTKAG